MLETFILILIFIMGAYFGSFYTLAVYRIPLGLNITHEHSFCPNCSHKLGILDLIPILSYVFLGGKCRYCSKKIKPRYCILEVLSGLTFLLFTISLNIDLYNIQIDKIVLLGFSFIYFAGLFIIAGIDKEKIKVQKNVLLYLIIVSALYMVYLYVVQKVNIYRYAIYLIIMIILIILDTIKIRKKGEDSYSLNILILSICMAAFTGEQVFLLTVIYTLLSISIYLLIKKIKQKLKKYVKMETKKTTKLPIAFYLSVTNIIIYIFASFLLNYFIK